MSNKALAAVFATAALATGTGLARAADSQAAADPTPTATRIKGSTKDNLISFDCITVPPDFVAADNTHTTPSVLRYKIEGNAVGQIKTGFTDSHFSRTDKREAADYSGKGIIEGGKAFVTVGGGNINGVQEVARYEIGNLETLCQEAGAAFSAASTATGAKAGVEKLLGGLKSHGAKGAKTAQMGPFQIQETEMPSSDVLAIENELVGGRTIPTTKLLGDEVPPRPADSTGKKVRTTDAKHQ